MLTIFFKHVFKLLWKNSYAQNMFNVCSMCYSKHMFNICCNYSCVNGRLWLKKRHSLTFLDWKDSICIFIYDETKQMWHNLQVCERRRCVITKANALSIAIVEVPDDRRRIMSAWVDPDISDIHEWPERQGLVEDSTT